MLRLKTAARAGPKKQIRDIRVEMKIKELESKHRCWTRANRWVGIVGSERTQQKGRSMN